MSPAIVVRCILRAVPGGVLEPVEELLDDLKVDRKLKQRLRKVRSVDLLSTSNR